MPDLRYLLTQKHREMFAVFSKYFRPKTFAKYSVAGASKGTSDNSKWVMEIIGGCKYNRELGSCKNLLFIVSRENTRIKCVEVYVWNASHLALDGWVVRWVIFHHFHVLFLLIFYVNERVLTIIGGQHRWLFAFLAACYELTSIFFLRFVAWLRYCSWQKISFFLLFYKHL